MSGFELMVHWLYRRHLLPLLDKQDAISGRELPEVRIIFTRVEFFIQAEKFLLSDKAKIEAPDNMIPGRMTKETTMPDTLHVLGQVLKVMPDDSPLRTLILDYLWSDFNTRDSFTEFVVKELSHKEYDFDIVVFLPALKER
jgi:hypothetical protein